MAAIRIRTNKYGNKKTTVDGITFDSSKEAHRYGELVMMQRAGLISGLERQPKFDLIVNGEKVGKYTADYRYFDHVAGHTIVEDVKSKPTMTAVYRLKKRLMKAIHRIDIKEIQ